MKFKPGDLVMVVKPRECCGNRGSIGAVATVVSRIPSRTVYCTACGFVCANDETLVSLDDNTGCETSRLIKIDHLTEQDKTETLQEITA